MVNVYRVNAEVKSTGAIWMSITSPNGSTVQDSFVGFENPTEEVIREKKLELKAQCDILNAKILASDALLKKVFKK